MNEKNYIRYRKIKAKVQSLCFYICRVFPIDSKLISICTFEGKGGFGCNPKYIVEELHRRDNSFRFVWFVNKNDWDKEFPDYIKKVPNTLWNRAYYLSTSRIWIDNYRKPLGTKKRKGQFYLNTWHGMVGFKSIGLWREKSFSRIAKMVSENDSKLVDCFLSDSKFASLYFPKGLLYDGTILEVGAPRCDILVTGRKKAKRLFYEKKHIPKEFKCIMFAPTFRETDLSAKRRVFYEDGTIDFNRLLKTMSTRFGSSWILCLRIHPQVSSSYYDLPEEKIIDLSREPDMYECLAAMDAFITDYSSSAMDAAIMQIPVFIYADDLVGYKEKRGDFVWELDSNSRGYNHINKKMLPQLDAYLPFTIARNNDELEDDIRAFDAEKYSLDLKQYVEGIGLVADGKASLRVADLLMREMGRSG